MSTEALGSVGHNWSWHSQPILNKMLMNSTNSKKNRNSRPGWFLIQRKNLRIRAGCKPQKNSFQGWKKNRRWKNAMHKHTFLCTSQGRTIKWYKSQAAKRKHAHMHMCMHIEKEGNKTTQYLGDRTVSEKPMMQIEKPY